MASRALRDVGSPGVAGYAVAVAASLLVLGFEIGVVSVFSSDNGAQVLSPADVVGGVLGLMVMVVLFGAIPAAVIGLFGVLLVHLLTLGIRWQAWHVLVAGLTGLGATLVVSGMLPLWMLPVATMAGRAAVIPFASKRRSRTGSPAYAARS
jgi:hypothetical protein